MTSVVSIAVVFYLLFFFSAKPIKVVSKLHDVKCKVGQPVEFTCEIDDPDADANVEWFKDDKPIKVGKSITALLLTLVNLPWFNVLLKLRKLEESKLTEV